MTPTRTSGTRVAVLGLIMDAPALHLEVRNALSLSDELGRHEHALGNDTFAGQLAALRTALADLEKLVGLSHARRASPNPVLIERIHHLTSALRDEADRLPGVLRPRLGLLLDALDRIVFAELRPTEGVPSKQVLRRRLPLKRLISQDIHSIGDYVGAGLLFLSAYVARTRSARRVGLVLGAKLAGISLLTDCRLSPVKAIAIETHELVADHALGAGAVLAPFVLGYVRRDRASALLQILAGSTAIARALVTDYRAAKGVGAPRLRSKGGPMQPARRHKSLGETLLAPLLGVGPRVARSLLEAAGVIRPSQKKAIGANRANRANRAQRRVTSEVQRPLEGLAGPSHLSPLDL